MREHKNFWDRNAGRYDRFMRKDRAAYEKMYGLIRPVVKGKTVLELATGTGLIAKNIVNAAAHIEASDTSAENDSGGKTQKSLCQAALFGAGYVPPALCRQVLRRGDRVQRAAHRAAAGESSCRDSSGAEGRWRAHRADLHPRGELVFRQGQGIFHEAGGLSSPQQVDERGILALPAANGWAVAESVVLKVSFPLTYAECEKTEV